MSNPIDDGGPAFPNNDSHGCAYTGMTLRDWFAGQALPGLLAQRQEPGDYDGPNSTTDAMDAGIVYKGNFISHKGDDSEYLAEDAYSMADAMLAERERRAK